MDGPVRIGLSGLTGDSLSRAVAELPMAPEVHSFADLFADAEAILAADLDLLITEETSPPAEFLGGLRLLRRARPSLPVLVVCRAAREVSLRTACEDVGARLLLLPLRSGALAAAVEQALQLSDRPDQEVFLDLAHGFADEINNPLLYLTGHLQLLMAQAGDQGDVQEQLEAALQGAQRIQECVERIRMISRAATGPRQRDELDLAYELNHALREHGSAAGKPKGKVKQGKARNAVVMLEPDEATFTWQGDLEVLREAFARFVQVVFEIAGDEGAAHFTLSRLDGSLRLRAALSGPGTTDWHLPQTFEPYYLNRRLSGSTHGLSLFLVQAAVLGHGGQATARRLPDGALALDLHLPNATPTQTEID